MKALLVIAHPCDDSFNHAAAAAAIRGLEAAGHEVEVIDLYRDGFTAAMSQAERTAYHSDVPILDEQVSEHARQLGEAQILVFVYPNWWSGLPAILKGWLERTMVPGVGFVFDRHGKVRPGLPHVRRIIGISTYGSPWWYVKIVNDNGRRVLTRALRLSCGWRARPRWLALYAMDTRTDDDRQAFLQRIEAQVGGT